MLSYSENSRKQEIIHQCFHLPQPPKRDSCDSCDSFQGEGYMNSGCFQIVIIIFNLLYI